LRFNHIEKLPQELIANLDSLEYREMTEIQAESIPVALEGRDLIAQAKTGSGKTAAFGIPTIMGINSKWFAPQVLIMTPTRELGDQVTKELRKLARYRENIKIVTLCGGVPMKRQIASLEMGAHIVVGTPGRLQDHLSRETLDLSKVSTLILDEADRMLDMGFLDEIKRIISHIPAKRQTLLFSATFPPKIESLSKHVLKDPVTIKIESTHTSQVIEQRAYLMERGQKAQAVIDIIQSQKPRSVLIFVNMKLTSEELADELYDAGFAVQALNGDLEQRERNEALLMFANTTVPILIATDVASRGLDVKDIELVINADLPHDPEIYTHRIGRTGRAGSRGVAITLYTQNQAEKLPSIAPSAELSKLDKLDIDKKFVLFSDMVTLCIDGGKRSKLRAGDILGTLCKDIGIDAKDIGKIDIFDYQSYIAVQKSVANRVFDGLKKSRIKKRNFRVWRM